MNKSITFPHSDSSPEKGSGFNFSGEPFACGVYSPLMDDFKPVRLVMKGINPGRAPFMHPDQRYSTVGGSFPPEDAGIARRGGTPGICWVKAWNAAQTPVVLRVPHSEELASPRRRSC